jgi:hypothetical protein
MIYSPERRRLYAERFSSIRETELDRASFSIQEGEAHLDAAAMGHDGVLDESEGGSILNRA